MSSVNRRRSKSSSNSPAEVQDSKSDHINLPLPLPDAAPGQRKPFSTRRDSVVDRRSGLDRRDCPDDLIDPADLAAELANGNDLSTNLERRRGPGRRRTDFMRAAEEGEMTNEQFLFVMAIDAFKRVNGKTFPTWTEVLEVIRKLGYRKTMPSELNLGERAEDWTEQANAPAGVFKREQSATDFE